MSSDFKAFLLTFAAVTGIFLAAGFAYKYGSRKGEERGFREGYYAPHPADTIYRVDSFIIDRPVEVIKWKEKDRPVYIAVHDTTTINDTTFVVLPREVKVYADSAYKAHVSGVEPSLDWIEVYQRTQVITERVVKDAPRWSFGITAGPGVLYDGEVRAGIGIVAGVQYRF